MDYHHQGWGAKLEGKDWNPGDDEPERDCFMRVIRGNGTPEDRERVLRMLEDPNSELHDYLEQFAEWAQKAFDRPDTHAEIADAMLLNAAARNDRNNIVRFVIAKKASGVIDEAKASAILAAGQIDETKLDEVSESQLRSATEAMTNVLMEKCPELRVEADLLRWPTQNRRGQNGGLPP